MFPLRGSQNNNNNNYSNAANKNNDQSDAEKEHLRQAVQKACDHAFQAHRLMPPLSSPPAAAAAAAHIPSQSLTPWEEEEELDQGGDAEEEGVELELSAHAPPNHLYNQQQQQHPPLDHSLSSVREGRRRGGGGGGATAHSIRSSERAVHRGSARGQREPMEDLFRCHGRHDSNSSSGDDDDEDEDSVGEFSDFDITTVTEPVTEVASSSWKDGLTRRRQRGRTRNQQQQQEQQQTNANHRRHHKHGKNKGGAIFLGFGNDRHSSKLSSGGKLSSNGNAGGYDDGIWMCGVCGKTFVTLEAAERHETDHVNYVVSGLGWAGDDANPNNLNFLLTPLSQHNRPLPGGSFSSSYSNTAAKGEKAGRRSRTNSYDSFCQEQASYEQRPSRPNRQQRYNGAPPPVPPLPATRARFFGDEHEEEKRSEDYTRNRQTVALDAASWSGRGGGAPLAPLRNSIHRSSYGSEGGGILRHAGEVRFDATAMADYQHKEQSAVQHNLLNDYIPLADEGLVSVCQRAEPLILSSAEKEAEHVLTLLAKDKAYYDLLTERAIARTSNPSNRFRSDGETMLAKVQNKVLDAYQLMKQGDQTRGVTDQYNRTQGSGSGADCGMVHSKQTLFVNVMVKNSVHVVKQELEKLATQKWERPEDAEKFTNFKRFRVYAHMNIVRLAGIALASDFTPRRIAIQLSNDLYRLLTPRLKRRGVTIETEIEYRVGGYFVLAVNISSVDWTRLIKANRKDVLIRRAKWKKRESKNEAGQEKVGKVQVFLRWVQSFGRILSLTRSDVVAQVFLWLYHFHWVIQLAVCYLAYYSVLGGVIRRYILQSVTDDIFYYVEERGMEMEIVISSAQKQAALMLSALREIRADGRELKKKQKATETQQDGGVLLGPLLGPGIKADKLPAVAPPGFEVPKSLEFIGLELDLPVGFRRLRWAMLGSSSVFMAEALMKTEAKYENIEIGKWDKHDEHIGLASLPPDVNPEDFVGAERESSFLMPKSAFVGANMCYELSKIVAYNDYCFCLLKRAKNPDVPFGNTFFAWTQYIIVNTGHDSCRMICSVEAEYPNGPPMMARQIQSGMRAGTAELFVMLGETITRYAQAYQ